MFTRCECALLIFQAVLSYYGLTGAQDNVTSTTLPGASAYRDDDKKGFPAWLVGVIVLSALVVIIAVATIVQRILRRRAAHAEQYRMAS